MQGLTGIAAPVSGIRPALRAARRGLAEVLIGADLPLPDGGRSPWRRRAGYAMLGGATLVLCAASLASLVGGPLCPGGKVRQVGQYVDRCLDPHQPLQIFGGPMNLWALVAVAAVAVPLALAVRYPLLSWRLGWLGLLLVPLLGLTWRGRLPWGPAQILALLLVLCAAGMRRDRAVLGWLWALTLIPWWFWIARRDLGLATGLLGSVAFLAVAVAVSTVGAGHQVQRDLAAQAELTELERARRTALEERTRIARELHDVVAHHMSLVAIRAESAPHRLGALPDPELVHAEFGSLSGSAREAMADMRRLLNVLRSDQPAGHAPQPGLEDLPGLIGSARQAGMAVRLSVPPGLGKVPPGAGMCVYRIIQEALSNAGRHAAGAPVAVSVDHDADTVTLQVTNGPGVPAGPQANGHGPGHGLAGMRERAELLGGSLSAGPAPDGGFAVSAVIPLGGSA
jgi:signal transduction histidine kinase